MERDMIRVPETKHVFLSCVRVHVRQTSIQSLLDDEETFPRNVPVILKYLESLEDMFPL